MPVDSATIALGVRIVAGVLQSGISWRQLSEGLLEGGHITADQADAIAADVQRASQGWRQKVAEREGSGPE